MEEHNNIIRICDYFNNNLNGFVDSTKESMWHTISNMSKQYFVHFKNKDYETCSKMLQNIDKTTIMSGYDILDSKFPHSATWKDDIKSIYKTFDILINEMNITPIYKNGLLDIEELFPLIDIKCGFKVDFPVIYNYSKNASMTTSRGPISLRMIFALYYVWNIYCVLIKNGKPINKASVIEIGAGTGRTAYYAYKFGFSKYTIVDIVSTGIVQAHYNINVLGSNLVCLYGENFNESRFLNIIPSSEFNNLVEPYDVVCNFDGITEYGIKSAMNYIDHSSKITSTFLSINHVNNGYSFTDLYKNNKNMHIVLKEPCCYRVEPNNTRLTYFKELINFTKLDI